MFRKRDDLALDRATDVSSWTAERAAPYYQTLLAQLQLLGGNDTGPWSIGLTGCNRGAGVSTVVTNLALATAMSRGQVLLLDAQWHSPALSKSFGLRHSPGWTDVLAGTHELTSAVYDCGSSGMFVMPLGRSWSGRIPVDGEFSLKALLAQLRPNYQRVFVDLPLVSDGIMTLPWAAVLDGTVLVLESERTSKHSADQAIKTLSRCHAKLLGTVFNKRRRSWIDHFWRKRRHPV